MQLGGRTPCDEHPSPRAWPSAAPPPQSSSIGMTVMLVWVRLDAMFLYYLTAVKRPMRTLCWIVVITLATAITLADHPDVDPWPDVYSSVIRAMCW